METMDFFNTRNQIKYYANKEVGNYLHSKALPRMILLNSVTAIQKISRYRHRDSFELDSKVQLQNTVVIYISGDMHYAQ